MRLEKRIFMDRLERLKMMDAGVSEMEMEQEGLEEFDDDWTCVIIMYAIITTLLYCDIFQLVVRLADLGHLKILHFVIDIRILGWIIPLLTISAIAAAVKLYGRWNAFLVSSVLVLFASTLCLWLLIGTSMGEEVLKSAQLDIDKYHQEYETQCFHNPYILLNRMQEDPAHPALFRIGDEYYMERQNDGVFHNDFSFELDLLKRELRVPERGNGVFFKYVLSENPSEIQVYGTVKTNNSRSAEQLAGTYDRKRRMFVVALPEDMPVDGYGFAEISIGTYTSRKLIGDRKISWYQKLIYGGKYRIPARTLCSPDVLAYLKEQKGGWLHILWAISYLTNTLTVPIQLILVSVVTMVIYWTVSLSLQDLP